MFDSYVFTTIMFLDYGKDSANNPTRAMSTPTAWPATGATRSRTRCPTKLFLARVPKNAVQDSGSWEFYAGDLAGGAKWTKQIKSKQPVLQDDRRIYKGGVTVELMRRCC
jgi:hypothetical protein